MKINVKESKDVRYLKLDVAVRYGDEDIQFDAPMRKDNNWIATIDLEEKRIINWPLGKTLCFKDMKVCDEGVYSLLDSDFKEIIKISDYVPNHLLPGGYGDYLSLDIDENGGIKNWLEGANLDDFEKRE